MPRLGPRHSLERKVTIILVWLTPKYYTKYSLMLRCEEEEISAEARSCMSTRELPDYLGECEHRL